MTTPHEKAVCGSRRSQASWDWESGDVSLCDTFEEVEREKQDEIIRLMGNILPIWFLVNPGEDKYRHYY